MALRPWLLSHLIKDSGKLCSILTKRLVPAGPVGPPPPFTPWVLLILSSSALTGFPHGPHQNGAERACPCPCARRVPTFWLRSSEFTCRDFTTALGSSSREGWCHALGGGFLSQPASPREGLKLPGTLGTGGASGGLSRHPSHFPPGVCMQ